MSVKSLLKRLKKALPVVLAAAPGVADAVKQVLEALKKPKTRIPATRPSRRDD